MKHTKIVCTIGPASNTKTTLAQMMSAGMNVARLNFSHGDYPDHAKLIRTIRAASKETGHPVALLQDLQGPRIRIGDVPEEGIEIAKGDKVVLVSQSEYERHAGTGKEICIPTQYPALAKYVKKGGHILIQDGTRDLIVQKTEKGRIYCTVFQGGVIKSHKGLNAPGADISGAVITAKDKEDVKFGVKQDVDFIALSFVKEAKNITQLRKLIPKNKKIKIIAKIERAEAIDNFDEILEEVDGIMVARGDLGVELGTAAVPLLQKKMILKCVRAGKPVITATQMLESMIETPRPTRAEAADVANAIIDHTDAIMLSGESATGKYPVRAVRTMTSIARKIERSPADDLPVNTIKHRSETPETGVAHAGVMLGESVKAKAIAVFSESGNVATLMSQLRPQHLPIVVFTNNDRTLRQMQLVWGVKSAKMAKPKSRADFAQKATAALLKHKWAKKKDVVVLISSHTAVETAEV